MNAAENYLKLSESLVSVVGGLFLNNHIMIIMKMKPAWCPRQAENQERNDLLEPCPMQGRRFLNGL